MPLLYHPPEATVYRVTFADADMDGLEVRIRAVPMARALELENITVTDGRLNMPAEDVRALYKEIADQIVSWNMPVEPSLDALLAQEPAWVIKFMIGWVSAMAYIAEIPTTVAVEEEDLVNLPMEVAGG